MILSRYDDLISPSGSEISMESGIIGISIV